MLDRLSALQTETSSISLRLNVDTYRRSNAMVSIPSLVAAPHRNAP
jgi:hypothetical protein